MFFDSAKQFYLQTFQKNISSDCKVTLILFMKHPSVLCKDNPL